MFGWLVISVELVDPRFYHLDTCFCPLPDGAAVWFPEAFDEYGQRAIREHVPELIDVLPEEAMHFSCNAVVIDRDIVLPAGGETGWKPARPTGKMPVLRGLLPQRKKIGDR